MATPIIPTHPMPISIATPSRDSMTFTSTKGLLNGPGQNNCFLNSAVQDPSNGPASGANDPAQRGWPPRPPQVPIVEANGRLHPTSRPPHHRALLHYATPVLLQVLWHLDIFRRSFRDLSGHACMADSCIFCALKELFSQLQFSNETALPPDALRRALAESFFDQQRFQLGFMDDAAECFENMLLRIHMHIAHGEAEDMCNARHCIPHQKFAMTLVEQSVCGSCGATSEPLSYTQMVHYVSTSTLVYQVRNNSNRAQTNGMVEPFGQLLRKAGSMGDVRVCPSACGAVIQIGRTLMNRPEIVSIGLVWNSERPTLEHIMEVFSTIGTTLRLSDVFNTVVDSRWAEVCVHKLVGVVTYYGKHYSTFFFHTKLKVWIYFDDATVREVGPRWEQVVEKCRKGRYQPLLLLYALPDGTPVSTENAPKQITPFYNDKALKKPPSQSLLRRSVTPSPEKPNVGGSNTRRAITPNPDGTSNQKPPLPRVYNDYQNLSVIQKNLYNNSNGRAGVDMVDGDLPRKDPEYVSRKSLDFAHQKPPNIHRTLSNGSSSGTEACFRDYLNVPRTRDSGNWSSDRNSASSSSSTTMENPYLYLVGKVHHDNAPNASLPRNESSSSNSSGVYDVGYDSYSLSSNDSSTMTTIQHLMKMGHLAKIPEDYNSPPAQVSQSCDVLCDEADELLVKSRQLEDDHDLVLALALCNAAATKARAAMDAPYNNPQTLTLARMKHNTCIMRARSLHRRMTQNQVLLNKDVQPEIRHTREGSSGSGRHSRQSSRDKGQHSRQNSKELLQHPQEKIAVHQPVKNIEIYATLPKKKDALKKVAINIEESDYISYDKPPGRESRSIFSRSKNKEQKAREKRSRSEDRNKMSRDFSIAPEIISGKDTLKKAKEEKEEKKDKDSKGKKQHKIRRKLLMGGLIRRKNRSMPDLTEPNVEKSDKSSVPTSTVDDSSIGLKEASSASMCGYLSEGHLEFTGTNANPNLERSKLMRKSFHGSAGKILTAAKVPPPPPLRTTSQLSTSKLNGGEVCEDKSERPQYPLPNELSYNMDAISKYIPPYCNQPHLRINQQYPQCHQKFNSNEEIFRSSDSSTVITRADVHQEQIKPYHHTNIQEDEGVDEVDCLPSRPQLQFSEPTSHYNSIPKMANICNPNLQSRSNHSNLPDSTMDSGSNQNLDLPPYPSPIGSAIHSRQASEEFPPPPPPLDLSALDEHLPKDSPPPTPSPGSLLAQLQTKRQEILSQESDIKTSSEPKSSGETWLKELQAKQAALRLKRNQIENHARDVDTVDQKISNASDAASKITSVKDLANKFEKVLDTSNYNNQSKCEVEDRAKEIIQLNDVKNELSESNSEENNKRRLGKKKSVSFCDQVILVATAEEQEDDSYIPNPILERVLRSAMNKPETAQIRQEIKSLREQELAAQYQDITEEEKNEQPLYVRRNSMDNLLSRQNSNNNQDTVDINHLNNNNNVNHVYGTNQYNGMINKTPPPVQPLQSHQAPVQASPYQRIPPNSPAYIYSNSAINKPLNPGFPGNQYPKHIYPQEYNQNYKPTYNPPLTQVRQSPTPNNYPQQYHPVYQHPPSPSPSNYSYNYQQNYENQRSNNYDPRQFASNHRPDFPHQQPSIQAPSPHQLESNGNLQRIPDNTYQRVPPPHFDHQQRVPPSHFDYPRNDNNYQRVPPQHVEQRCGPTHLERVPSIDSQRVPTMDQEYARRMPPPHHVDPEYNNYIQTTPKYSPYQHALPPKQLLKKTVSFEPGTKGGTESPTPKAVITPIIVNNANNSVPTGKTKCNLCRKKAVVSANLYCTDCEFYMSRFKPKR